MLSSLLVVALGASAILFGTTDARAEEGSIDKNLIVCAAVFPCHPTTFKLLEAFAHPTTFEGLFCKAKYELTCKAAQKIKHEQKRKNRPGKKKLTKSRR